MHAAAIVAEAEIMTAFAAVFCIVVVRMLMASPPKTGPFESEQNRVDSDPAGPEKKGKRFTRD